MTRLTLTTALVLPLVMTLTTPVPGAAEMPETLSVGDDTRLQLTGQGTREKFLFDLYTVGLYLPRTVEEVEPIRQHGMPKAFRVEIVYDGSIPDDIPESWWEELVPVLDSRQQERMKALYRRLQPEDTILISYAPDQGTRIGINGETKITDQGHALMSAYIDIWLGGNPVSEDLRRSLL